MSNLFLSTESRSGLGTSVLSQAKFRRGSVRGILGSDSLDTCDIAAFIMGEEKGHSPFLWFGSLPFYQSAAASPPRDSKLL